MPLGGGRLLPKVTQKKEQGNEIYNTFSHDEEGEKRKEKKKENFLLSRHTSCCSVCVKLGVVSSKSLLGKRRDRTWQTFSLVPRETFFSRFSFLAIFSSFLRPLFPSSLLLLLLIDQAIVTPT